MQAITEDSAMPISKSVFIRDSGKIPSDPGEKIVFVLDILHRKDAY
jgi:hypothetical protein